MFLYNGSEDAAYSIRAGTIIIAPRERPSDYIYTEEEVLLWSDIERKVLELSDTVEDVAADTKSIGEQLDIKLNNRETAYALELSEELMPDAPAWSGGGWTKTGDGGYAHAVGQTAPLSIALTEEIGEDFYLISFTVDSPTDTSSPDASVAIYPSIGGSDAFTLYDGNTGTRNYEKIIRSVSGSDLVFQPCDPNIPTDTTNGEFDGTIRNISVRRVLSVREANIVMYDENGNAAIEMRQTPTERYNFYMGLGSGKHDATGKGNVAIGKDTLSDNTSGFWNVALGQGALKANTVGSRNIAIGRVALQENTSGDRNIAIGTFALCRSHGFRNIAVGADAAWYVATGNNNIAIGTQAMGRATSANNNTVIGDKALKTATDFVDHNVIIGENAITVATGASDNVIVGRNACASVKTIESAVVIGNDALLNSTRAARSIIIGADAGRQKNAYNDVICIGNFSEATKAGQTILGGYKTVETVVRGDFIVLGTDGVKRKIVFNTDGTCSWTAV